MVDVPGIVESFAAGSVSFTATALISPINLSSTLAEPAGFSLLEIGLLVLCVAASGGLFFWRLGPILRNVFRSKKDADFSLHPLGRRTWVFFWEVLCQGKVIKERPAPGIAHAFVFWGFLAFALVSLNHFATGVRRRRRIASGGSLRDDEDIDAAKERGVAMIFTGVRHFRH